MKRVVFSILVMSLIVLVGCSSTVETDQSVSTLSVTGNAQIKLQPDVARFTISAESIESTSDEARAKTSTMINQAVDILMNDFGIARNDIATNYIDISPYYEWQDNQRILRGQCASQSLDITLHDISKYGDIFTSISKVNGLSVSTASLDKKDKSMDLDEVRRLSVMDANGKAKVYADAAGVDIIGVLSISSGSGSVSYPRVNAVYKATAMDAESNTEYYADDITLSDSVSIIYKIK